MLTRDRNPVNIFPDKSMIYLVSPSGFEPETYRLKVRCLKLIDLGDVASDYLELEADDAKSGQLRLLDLNLRAEE
jgi:hypothetical protein